MNQNFDSTFKKLKAVLLPYVDLMELVTDVQDEIYLNTHHIMKNNKPLFFAAVKINKKYVSFHLMPIYVAPSLTDTISPALLKRKQGKSCFNFKELEEEHITELQELTRRGFESYQKQGFCK